MWKLHGNKQGLRARCLSTSYSIAFRWSWTVQVTWRQAFSFSRMLLPTSSPTEFETNRMKYDFHITEPLSRTHKFQWLCHRTICRRIWYSGLGSGPRNYLQTECQLVHRCYSCLITCGNFFCCKTFTCEDSAVHTSNKNMKKVVWIWSFHCTLTF
jgi:hypothetical protein